MSSGIFDFRGSIEEEFQRFQKLEDEKKRETFQLGQELIQLCENGSFSKFRSLDSESSTVCAVYSSVEPSYSQKTTMTLPSILSSICSKRHCLVAIS